MIQGISNLYPGARSVPTNSTSKVSGSFQSMLEATEKTASKDQVDISGMSYQEKIKALQKLHEETDYSGMTVTEKYKLINSRFESYFPDFYAIQSGLYGAINTQPDGTCYGENPVRVAVTNEFVRQYRSAGVKFVEVPEGEIHREAFYPGMTDDEIRSAIQEKYQNGTMTDRAGALYELGLMRLTPPSAASSAIDAMRSQLVMQVKGTNSYAGLSTGSALLESRIMGIASGTPMSWGEIAKITIDHYGDTEENRAYYEEMMNAMLDSILGRGK